MSCSPTCKTNPCTFPHCVDDTAERIVTALETDARAGYTSGYSDGYDAALQDVGAGVPWWVGIGVWVWGALVGAACAWTWL